MSEGIVNKVANSPLVTLNLEDLYEEGDRVVFDMKDHLFQGLILREKDFRSIVKENDWTVYQDKFVAVTCTADAIIPTWAYMLIANKLEGIARFCFFGTTEEMETHLFLEKLKGVDPSQYADKPVVVKGCFDKPIPVSAYMEVTRMLTPHVKSLFYGEPCSTVPIFKKKVKKD